MRLVRSQVIAVKSSDYVAAARAMGASNSRILVRHILPNAVAPVLVYATITIGVLIAAEATLTYLGVGLQRPANSWGLQIEAGQSLLRTAPAPRAVPQPGPDPDRDGLHHDGRRPARRPRPEAARMTRSETISSTEPARTGAHLLEVDDLRVEFRQRSGHRQRRQRRQLHAGRGADPGDPRRVRLRQVGVRAGDHGHPRHPAGGHHRRHPVRGPRHAADVGRGPAEDPRSGHLDDLPGRAVGAEPRLQRGLADRRDVPRAPGRLQEGGQAAGHRADGPGADPGRRAAGERLPAPVLRRHAPARDDRDGDRAGPAAS